MTREWTEEEMRKVLASAIIGPPTASAPPAEGLSEPELNEVLNAWHKLHWLNAYDNDRLVKHVAALTERLAAAEGRYATLYDATRDLCALVDATIPNMMMSPDQGNNAYAIVERMRAALTAPTRESGEEVE